MYDEQTQLQDLLDPQEKDPARILIRGHPTTFKI